MKKFYLILLALGLVAACTDEKDDDIPNDQIVTDLEEHLNQNYIIYHGETYKTVTFSNGTTWMAENLRYLPEGYVPSSDPAAEDTNVWYPYKFNYEQAVADDAVSTSLDASYVVPLTDDASVKERGYLYNLSGALGVEVNEDNYLEFEDVQGICPDGWHIPNRAEWFDLVGASNKGYGESGAPENYTDALLWDSVNVYATVGNAIDKLGFTFSGAVFNGNYQATVIWSGNTSVEDYYGQQGITYLWTSTPYSATQYFAVMTTFTATGYPLGRLSLAWTAFATAAPVRCIRNSGIDFYQRHGFTRPAEVVE